LVYEDSKIKITSPYRYERIINFILPEDYDETQHPYEDQLFSQITFLKKPEKNPGNKNEKKEEIKREKY